MEAKLLKLVISQCYVYAPLSLLESQISMGTVDKGYYEWLLYVTDLTFKKLKWSTICCIPNSPWYGIHIAFMLLLRYSTIQI